MIINHNLGLPRYAISVRFFDVDMKPWKGAVYSIHDDDHIELDEDWLGEHPEICHVEISGVGENYEGKRFGCKIREDFRQDHVASPLEHDIGDLIATIGLVLFDIRYTGIGCVRRLANGTYERVDPSSIRFEVE